MRKLAQFLLVLPFLLIATGCITGEEQKSFWTEITPNLYRYVNNSDNMYLLKNGERGTIFGASTETILEHISELGVKNIEWCFVWNARRSQVNALPKFKESGIRIGAPDTSSRKEDGPENHFLQRSEEYWESTAWLLRSGYVTTQAQDIPLFTVKPDFLLTKRPEDPILRISWADYLIDVIPVATPHRRAVSFLIELNGTRYCISGRMILDQGRFRDLTDIWWDEYDPMLKNYSEVEHSITELVAKAQVATFLPEVGEPIPASLAAKIVALAKTRISAVADLFPQSGNVTDDIVPGIKKLMFKGATYIINGGNGHMLVVNAGFSPALEMIPDEVGENNTCDFIFITDCRDIHSICAPSLADALHCNILACPSAERILKNPHSKIFPKNINRPTGAINPVADGSRMSWQGAMLSFYDLPELGAGRQMMLFESPYGDPDAMKILFYGDAVLDLRRFPIANPYYNVDLRVPVMRSEVMELIGRLRPTHIADDSGIRKLPPVYSLEAPLAWLAKYRSAVADLLCEGSDMRNADPFWCRPIPNVIEQAWGVKHSAMVRLKNYNETPLSLKLSLTGMYLKEGSDWSSDVVLGPNETADVPVEFSVAADCPRSGTAVGVRVEENGRTYVPAQFILQNGEK